jgi:hypothetical protein
MKIGTNSDYNPGVANPAGCHMNPLVPYEAYLPDQETSPNTSPLDDAVINKRKRAQKKMREKEWNLREVAHMTIQYKQAEPGRIQDIDPSLPPPPPPIWSLYIKADDDSALRIMLPAHAIAQINLHTRFFFPWNYKSMPKTELPLVGTRLFEHMNVIAEFGNVFTVELPFPHIEQNPIIGTDHELGSNSALLIHADKVQFKYTMPQIVEDDGYTTKLEMILSGKVAVGTTFTFGVLDVVESCDSLDISVHMPAARIWGSPVEWKVFVGIENGVLHRHANQTQLLAAFSKCMGAEQTDFSEADFSPISYAIKVEMLNSKLLFGAGQHNLRPPCADSTEAWFAARGVHSTSKKGDKKKSKIEQTSNSSWASTALSLEGPLITVGIKMGYLAYISPANNAVYSVHIGTLPSFRKWTQKDVLNWSLQFDNDEKRFSVLPIAELMDLNHIDGRLLAKLISGELVVDLLPMETLTLIEADILGRDDDYQPAEDLDEGKRSHPSVSFAPGTTSSSELDDPYSNQPRIQVLLPEWHTIKFHGGENPQLRFDSWHMDIATRFYDGRFFNDEAEFLRKVNSVIVTIAVKRMDGELAGVMVKTFLQFFKNQFGAETEMMTEDIDDDLKPILRPHKLIPPPPGPRTTVGLTLDVADVALHLPTSLYGAGFDKQTHDADNTTPSNPSNPQQGSLILNVSGLHLGLTSDMEKLHVGCNVKGLSLVCEDSVSTVQPPLIALVNLTHPLTTPTVVHVLCIVRSVAYPLAHCLIFMR